MCCVCRHACTHSVEGEGWGGTPGRESGNSWHLSALPLSLHQQMFMSWPGSWPSSWLLLKQSLKKGSLRKSSKAWGMRKGRGTGSTAETGEPRFRARKSQENSELGHLENVLHKNHHHQDHLNWSHLYLRNSNIIITAFLIKKSFYI